MIKKKILILIALSLSAILADQELESKNTDWHNGSRIAILQSEIDWKEILIKETKTHKNRFNFNKSKKYNHAPNNPVSFTFKYQKKKIITIDASSQFHMNYNVRFALDGNPKSYWLSQKSYYPHWIMVDFGSKRLFDRLFIRFGKFAGQPTIKKYHIQFFYKGKWFDYLKMDLTANKDKGISIAYLGGVDASRIRIYIPEKGTFRGYASIREFEIYLGKSRVMHFDPRLTNFSMPVEHGLLPDSDYLYPNAPRAYRGGIHAGIDFTHYYNRNKNYEPKKLTRQSKIIAVSGGVVLRSDHNYIPRTKEEYEKATQFWSKNNRTFVLRSFGGRQIWIDHENGVITAYNHLSKILPKISPGMRVKKGQVIGYAGNSGLRGESNGTDDGIHLHFEVWADGQFLGKNIPPVEVKKIFSWLFTNFQ